MLYQNNPNPFESKTTIKYFIPETSNSLTNVQIVIRDNSGKIISSVNINRIGEGEILFDFTNSTDKIFYYSLLIDTKIIDTKIMIKN